MKKIIVAFLVLITNSLMASHNKAGEITYRHINGLTYQITIKTYTSTLEGAADSPTLDVNWGDGSAFQTVGRDTIIYFTDINAKLNIYTAVHTYTGPGSFTIAFSDRYRNPGVINMFNSSQTAFYAESKLIINPFINSPLGGNNNSVQLLYPPLDEACLNEIYYHNPLAFDPDGDSLAYSLIPSRQLNGDAIPSYKMPDQIIPGNDNIMSIDPYTGDLLWIEPKKEGEYNVAILVEEYREGILMGTVVRDMQINVRGCANRGPEFVNIQDTCIEAGEVLNFEVKATDPDNNGITLNAFGYPLDKMNQPATFVQTSTNPGTGDFRWATSCEDVRKQRHQVLFRAEDKVLSEKLIALETYNITVIAPAPKNPYTMVVGPTIELHWEKEFCTNALGYYVYRRIDSLGYEPEYCQFGVPEYTGYKKIATLDSIADTTYIDNNVNYGTQYCYMVTAYFADGAESYPSVEFCGLRSKLDIPVLTKTSVETTGITNGTDSIKWSTPFDLDTVVFFTGPYAYELKSKVEGQNSFVSIYKSANNNSLSALPTSFVNTNQNTEELSRVYQVHILNADTSVGYSDNSTTHFLSLEETDNKMILTWTDQTSWQVDSFDVYESRNNSPFTLLGSTTDTSFESTGLKNGDTYCYYVEGFGKYRIIPSVIINNKSQIACGIPVDNVKPCTVGLNIDADCDEIKNELSWDNPNTSCAETDDVLQYRIYYSNNPTDALSLLATLSDPNETFYTHIQDDNIAGCYAISSIDSVGNESELSAKVCVDNCPVYSLPNVFTPNGDGINDTFRPIESKFVTDVEFTVFNRWGDIVFSTTDSKINWNGEHISTGKVVADGVYQYIATYKEKTLDGLIPKKTNGYLTLKSGGGKSE